MTNYPFDMQLVVDPFNPENVVANGIVTIYDPADTANATPIALTDTNGLPIGNPISSNSSGFTSPFIATSPQVKWVAGGYSGYFSSYIGMLNEAIAARQAAEDALKIGMPSGGLPGQTLTKTAEANYAAAWRTPFVLIGPTDEWPTDLPDGTIVIRTAA